MLALRFNSGWLCWCSCPECIHLVCAWTVSFDVRSSVWNQSDQLDMAKAFDMGTLCCWFLTRWNSCEVLTYLLSNSELDVDTAWRIIWKFAWTLLLLRYEKEHHPETCYQNSDVQLSQILIGGRLSHVHRFVLANSYSSGTSACEAMFYVRVLTTERLWTIQRHRRLPNNSADECYAWWSWMTQKQLRKYADVIGGEKRKCRSVVVE